jgi:hypothetical protein
MSGKSKLGEQSEQAGVNVNPASKAAHMNAFQARECCYQTSCSNIAGVLVQKKIRRCRLRTTEGAVYKHRLSRKRRDVYNCQAHRGPWS